MTAKFDLQHLHPGLFADYPSQLASSLHINPARQIHTTQQTPPPAPLTGHGRSMGQNRTDNLQKKNPARRPQLLPTKQRAARLALAGAALAFGGERQTSAAIGRLWIDLHVE
ncbi:hypothetical protein T03_16639 [Trichinella britovi]|uniref:Uncharacterized protein n=1 Tax=Trichinella britovi TaxID=45882 RepID=A0A0V1D9N3_TRIBR|nr:hypothetical protein T03_16639 [Trichinella britovi]